MTLLADKSQMERKPRPAKDKPMSLPLIHLRALYTEIVLRSGPGSTEAKEFCRKLNHNPAFTSEAQVVGELFRAGFLSKRGEPNGGRA